MSPQPSFESEPSASNALLAGLNQSQIDAVTAPNGRIVVLAGAGSGKTRVLSRRIAWRVAEGDVDPNRILALTFTRKAAAELRQRQRRLGFRDHVPAGTFHAIALAQVRQRWHESRSTPPTLLRNRTGFLARILPSTLDAKASAIGAEIDWARARLIAPSAFPDACRVAGRRCPIDPRELSEIMVRFAQEKKRRGVIDFDDLLTIAATDLESDPGYAAAVRWRHRHFFVDEFQDVNPLQYRLLNAWLGDRNDLFVVGDPNQAIYGWNGADPSLIETLAAEPSTVTIRLDDNYRSSPEILTVAGAAVDLDPKLVAHRPNGPVPTLTAHVDAAAEADGVARRIHDAHHAQSSWSDQAVLVRTNAQLVLLGEALKRWDIPTEVRAGRSLLNRGATKVVLDRLRRGRVEVIEALEQLDDELTDGPGGSGAGDDGATDRVSFERHNDLVMLSGLMHEYLGTDPRPSASGLIAWLALLGDNDFDRGRDAVSLLTFHSAKGLEWPTVHVAGLEDGYSPIVYAESEAQRDEEKRLLYVAMTRAEHALHLSWARARTFGSSTVQRDASPFLAAIDRRIVGLGPGGAQPVDWRRHLSSSRHRLHTNSGGESPSPSRRRNGQDEEEQLLDRLRSWRRRKAVAAKIPDHVVIADRDLRQIARQRPTTQAQLATLTTLGPSKLDRYGADLLALVGQESGGSSPEPGAGSAGFR